MFVLVSALQICAGIVYALQLPPLMLVVLNCANVLVYNAQLIVYNHQVPLARDSPSVARLLAHSSFAVPFSPFVFQRVFIETAGVEGQITTSCYYLVSAGLVAVYSHGFMEHAAGAAVVYMIAVGSTIAFLVAGHPFVTRFDSSMMAKWLGQPVPNACPWRCFRLTLT